MAFDNENLSLALDAVEVSITQLAGVVGTAAVSTELTDVSIVLTRQGVVGTAAISTEPPTLFSTGIVGDLFSINIEVPTTSIDSMVLVGGAFNLSIGIPSIVTSSVLYSSKKYYPFFTVSKPQLDATMTSGGLCEIEVTAPTPTVNGGTVEYGTAFASLVTKTPIINCSMLTGNNDLLSTTVKAPNIDLAVLTGTVGTLTVVPPKITTTGICLEFGVASCSVMVKPIKVGGSCVVGTVGTFNKNVPRVRSDIHVKTLASGHITVPSITISSSASTVIDWSGGFVVPDTIISGICYV